jgi:hypothetical protein
VTKPTAVAPKNRELNKVDKRESYFVQKMSTLRELKKESLEVSKYYITVVYFSKANRPFLADRSTSVLTDNMPARRGGACTFLEVIYIIIDFGVT